MRTLLIALAAVVSMTASRAGLQQLDAAGAAQERPAAGQPDAAQIVAAAARWIPRFNQNLSGLLFRERYRQQLALAAGIAGPRERIIEANVFLLKLPPPRDFVLFRDVYKIDHRAVGDHTERLEKLLAAGASDDVLQQARRLTDASARHNVGRYTRNVNIPTMALEYLAPEMIGRLRTRVAGTETVARLPAVIVEFEETARPTLVRGVGDVPAKGRYWIHAESGAVIRAELELTGQRTTGRMRVELELHPTLGVWVPKEMTEVWRSPAERINGFAQYDGYKRLAVSTKEVVK
ncbi:MAG: hypothetical protein WD690_10400 [Vicinamibacterales bacterium]